MHQPSTSLSIPLALKRVPEERVLPIRLVISTHLLSLEPRLLLAQVHSSLGFVPLFVGPNVVEPPEDADNELYADTSSNDRSSAEVSRGIIGAEDLGSASRFIYQFVPSYWFTGWELTR